MHRIDEKESKKKHRANQRNIDKKNRQITIFDIMKYIKKKLKKNTYVIGFVDYDHYERYHEEVAELAKYLFYIGDPDFVDEVTKKMVLQVKDGRYKNYMSTGDYYFESIHYSWASLMQSVRNAGYIVLCEI